MPDQTALEAAQAAYAARLAAQDRVREDVSPEARAALAEAIRVEAEARIVMRQEAGRDTAEVDEDDDPTAGEPDPEYDPDDPELIRAKWVMDGATTLEEAAAKLEAYAETLRGLAADGWKLVEPIADDYGAVTRDTQGDETAIVDSSDTY